jgi:putative glutamine amidotransferase
MPPRPVIGITTDVRADTRTLQFVFSEYVECVERAGGLPLHIPAVNPAAVPQLLDRVDGVVIVGGEDLDPALYGETPVPIHRRVPEFRQRFDIALARALLDTRHPVLGTCYGCQLLAVAAGGSLHQDVTAEFGTEIRHGGGTYPDLPEHDVTVVPGSRLHGVLGADRLRVNSAHHEAPREPGNGFVVAATAPGGVIEAIEAPGDRFALGVMWHPEILAAGRPDQQRLFDALVEAAAGR